MNPNPAQAQAMARAAAIRDALMGGAKNVGNAVGGAVDAGFGKLMDALQANQAFKAQNADRAAQQVGYEGTADWAAKNPDIAESGPKTDMLTGFLRKLFGKITGKK